MRLFYQKKKKTVKKRKNKKKRKEEKKMMKKNLSSIINVFPLKYPQIPKCALIGTEDREEVDKICTILNTTKMRNSV